MAEVEIECINCNDLASIAFFCKHPCKECIHFRPGYIACINDQASSSLGSVRLRRLFPKIVLQFI